MSVDAPETIKVTETRIACDGGGGALGHPKVYLTLSKEGEIDCPYCDRHFILEGSDADK